MNIYSTQLIIISIYLFKSASLEMIIKNINTPKHQDHPKFKGLNRILILGSFTHCRVKYFLTDPL